ncbi:signal recognition particle protein [Ferroacidibacillus organovorans]|uniref:Signal recognition particle protein n=1 Tax=Ferroacidibacillus organovorans TaxID=1765683 RepID=A0A853KAL4_9BACL|nr:signal recognition particle protein [Ferroacidibacillus organovorans]KYP80539.1 signal recognition particle protein [Ferroacidibacillus organovorans]OAG93394.1 signal recognition particle [Ferroacidibacillus organovorans]
MFESLSGRLQTAFSKLRGKGRLSETDVNDAMREIRRALLEADVNHVVAKKFVDAVKERAIGQDILQSLTAGQQVVSIVNDELTRLLGETQAKLERSAKPPTVVMMVGLQGAGKTTATAKLGRFLATSEHRRPLLVAADIYRPAAIDQLVALGQQIGVSVWAPGATLAPVEIVRTALDEARRGGYDYVLIDTAGRLHIDDVLMNELEQLQQLSDPEEILLVVDAMTGQDAVTVAQSFHEALGITGVVLTKMDGDTRGGAALSVRHVTGCPIKFVGTGERPDALEPFYPDRMASRILGMGDVLTLIEKAQAHFDEDQAKILEQKMRNNDFTLEDFLSQLQQVKKMGPLDQLMGMIPGLGGALKHLPQGGVDEKPLKRIEAIILSMSPEERVKPELVEKSSSRRVRIAKGSGTQVKDVNQLLRQFGEMRKMMKQFSAMGKGGKRSMAGLKNRLGAPRMPFGGGRGKRSR